MTCQTCRGYGAVNDVILRDPGAGQRGVWKLCPECRDEIAFAKTISALYPPETREERNKRILEQSRIQSEQLKRERAEAEKKPTLRLVPGCKDKP